MRRKETLAGRSLSHLKNLHLKPHPFASFEWQTRAGHHSFVLNINYMIYSSFLVQRCSQCHFYPKACIYTHKFIISQLNALNCELPVNPVEQLKSRLLWLKKLILKIYIYITLMHDCNGGTPYICRLIMSAGLWTNVSIKFDIQGYCWQLFALLYRLVHVGILQKNCSIGPPLGFWSRQEQSQSCCFNSDSKCSMSVVRSIK